MFSRNTVVTLSSRALTLLLFAFCSFSPYWSPYAGAQSKWVPVKSMLTARYDFPSTYGPDGRIYAIGGFTANYNTCYEAEAYDPALNTWKAIAPVPEEFPGHETRLGSIAAASNGRIYLFGGNIWRADGNFDVLLRVDAYNPKTNSWAKVSTMPTARFSPATTSGRNGFIYVIGGWTGYGKAPFAPPSSLGGFSESKVVEVYNPQTNVWFTLPPLSVGRGNLAATTGVDGRIYVIGGIINSGNNPNRPVKTVEVYDPRTNQWSTVAPLPVGQKHTVATTGPNGKIFVTGSDDQSNPLNIVQVYDPRTNTWTVIQPLNVKRYLAPLVASSDGRLYALGGITESFDGPRTNSVEACSFAPGDFAAGYFPDHGGNTGNATVSVVTPDNFPLSVGATVTLTAPGQPDIIGVSIKLVNSHALDVIFDLRGAPLGKRDVVITNADGSTRTYPQGFTVEKGSLPLLITNVLGRSQLRGGVFSTYNVLVQNLGNADTGQYLRQNLLVNRLLACYSVQLFSPHNIEVTLQV